MPRKSKDAETPPAVVKHQYRDEKGLLIGVPHSFTEDGLVNWVALIPDKYIVAKTGFEDKPFEELRDNEKLILLGGFKHLAKLRGYRRVGYHAFTADGSLVSMSCCIRWLPNFETEMEEVDFESCADASVYNTEETYNKFLTTIAENRAFSRCVRNFLGINILGKEEMAEALNGKPTGESRETNQVSQTTITPTQSLQKLMEKENMTFEKIRETMSESFPAAADWTSLDSIPKPQAMEIINRLVERRKKIESTKGAEADAPDVVVV